MLDSIKRINELRELLSRARHEREETASVLASLLIKREHVDEVDRSLKRAHDEAHTMTGSLGRLSARMDTLDTRLRAFEAVDARIARMHDAVTEVEKSAQDLVGPEGALQSYRAMAQQVNAQQAQARASLEALRKDQESLDGLRDQLRQAQGDVKDATDRFQATKTEFEQMRALAAQLTTDYGKVRDTTREARENAESTMDAAKEIEKKLSSFTALEEMSKTTKERLAALNLLAEHVTQKTKSLEAQKQTLEHAIVESNRLNEMVWSMDAQVAKLNENVRHVTRTEEIVDRLEKLARDASAHVDTATASKDAFLQDLGRMDKDRAALSEFIRGFEERVTLERKELDSFDHRLAAAHTAIADIEGKVETVTAKDRALAAMTQQIATMDTQAAALRGQLTEIERWQAPLESLHDRLNEVEDLSARTEHTYAGLVELRTTLGSLKDEIDRFYLSHQTALQLVDRLDADRVSLATLMERMDSFRSLTPELDAKLDTVTSRLSIVDEGVHKASNLVALADELDRQMIRIANNQKFVEKVETRVNALHALAIDIDGKLAEQLARRAELETMRGSCETVGVQVADVQQKIEALTAVQRALLPMRTEVATLKIQIDHEHARFKDAQQAEGVVAEQGRRLEELVSASRNVAAEVAAGLKQVQALADDLKQSTSAKDELLEELTRVQGRQRDVAAQSAASDEQTKRLDAALRQLEQRRTQMAFMEKSIAGFEAKFDTLRQLSEDLDRKIEAIQNRTAIVDAVKREVDGVHAVSARSRADLEYVTDQRAEVLAIRQQVDGLLASAAETQEQMVRIEDRRHHVEEIYGKTNFAVNLLEDVRLNLELITEQKAVVDHVASDLAKLDSLVTSSQRTLKALEAERELAARIEKSIKSLRAKAGKDDEGKGKRTA